MEKEQNDKKLIFKELKKLQIQLAMKKRRLEKLEKASKSKRLKTNVVRPIPSRNANLLDEDFPAQMHPKTVTDSALSHLKNSAMNADCKMTEAIVSHSDASNATKDTNCDNNLTNNTSESLELFFDDNMTSLLASISPEKLEGLCVGNLKEIHKSEKPIKEKIDNSSSSLVKSHEPDESSRNMHHRYSSSLISSNNTLKYKELDYKMSEDYQTSFHSEKSEMKVQSYTPLRKTVNFRNRPDCYSNTASIMDNKKKSGDIIFCENSETASKIDLDRSKIRINKKMLDTEIPIVKTLNEKCVNRTEEIFHPLSNTDILTLEKSKVRSLSTLVCEIENEGISNDNRYIPNSVMQVNPKLFACERETPRNDIEALSRLDSRISEIEMQPNDHISPDSLESNSDSINEFKILDEVAIDISKLNPGSFVDLSFLKSANENSKYSAFFTESSTSVQKSTNLNRTFKITSSEESDKNVGNKRFDKSEEIGSLCDDNLRNNKSEKADELCVTDFIESGTSLQKSANLNRTSKTTSSEEFNKNVDNKRFDKSEEIGSLCDDNLCNNKSEKANERCVPDFEENFEQYLSWLNKDELQSVHSSEASSVSNTKKDTSRNDNRVETKTPYEVCVEKSLENFNKMDCFELIEEEKEIVLYQKCLDNFSREDVVDISVFSLGTKYFIVVFLAYEVVFFETTENSYRRYSKWPLSEQIFHVCKGFQINNSEYAIIGILYVASNGCLDHSFIGIDSTGDYYPLHDLKCNPIVVTKYVGLKIYTLNNGFLSAIEGQKTAFVNIFSSLNKNATLTSLEINLSVSQGTSVCREKVLPYFFTCDSGYVSLWKYGNNQCIKQNTPGFERLPQTCQIKYASYSDEMCTILVSGYSDDEKENQCKIVKMSTWDVYMHSYIDLNFKNLIKPEKSNCDVKVLVDECHADYVLILVENHVEIFHFGSGNSLITLNCHGTVSKIACDSNLLVLYLSDGCLRIVGLKEPSLLDMRKEWILSYKW